MVDELLAIRLEARPALREEERLRRPGVREGSLDHDEAVHHRPELAEPELEQIELVEQHAGVDDLCARARRQGSQARPTAGDRVHARSMGRTQRAIVPFPPVAASCREDSREDRVRARGRHARRRGPLRERSRARAAWGGTRRRHVRRRPDGELCRSRGIRERSTARARSEKARGRALAMTLRQRSVGPRSTRCSSSQPRPVSTSTRARSGGPRMLRRPTPRSSSERSGRPVPRSSRPTRRGALRSPASWVETRSCFRRSWTARVFSPARGRRAGGSTRVLIDGAGSAPGGGRSPRDPDRAASRGCRSLAGRV